MLTPPQSMPGSPPDSCRKLTSKLLLLSMRLAQLLGMVPLSMLLLMLNLLKSDVLLPQASGRVPDNRLRLRSSANTSPGAKVAKRLDGRVPVMQHKNDWVKAG